jgi:serine phosphatase RsbU (regulator of sigma subunit)
VYIDVERFFSILAKKQTGSQIREDILTITGEFSSLEEYDTFFEQYSWVRNVLDPLLTSENVSLPLKQASLPEDTIAELDQAFTDRLADEVLNYVKNRFIGYAIVVDKDEVIQAHPDIGEYVGKQYVWPEGTTPLQEGDETPKIQECFYRGEPHYDLATPVVVRDKNLGTAYIGRVHIGLRKDSILEDIAKARQKVIYVTLIAVVIGSIGAYGLAVLIVKPVKLLVNDAEILGGGNLDHHIQIVTHDEVGTLAETLDATRVKLKDAREQLIISERLARELEIAREIQMTLLPKETPSLDRMELGTLYRAASQVGGDLYDFFWVSEHELGIVVADVAGKGVPGSLMMTMAKAVIRAKAVKSESSSHLVPVGVGGDPASVLRKTNQMIAQDIKKGMFITANYGIMNVQNLKFRFVSAGHNDTLIYNSRSGELKEYNPKGIALGLDKGTLFDMLLQDQELALGPGDLLFQFTDGVNEAMNNEKEEFGEERLKDVIRKYAHLPVNDFLEALDQEIRTFTEGFPQSDDITAVVVKVKD